MKRRRKFYEGEARFAYEPGSPLPQRPDGRFLTSVVVLGYKQFR